MLIDLVKLVLGPFPFENFTTRAKIKVYLKELYFGLMGMRTPKMEIVERSRILSKTWSGFEAHLNFMLKHYRPSDYVFSPIIARTATGVHADKIAYFTENTSPVAENALDRVSEGLEQLHSSITSERWRKWLSAYVSYLAGNELKDFDLLRRLQGRTILEIGPGIGAVMLLLGETFSREQEIVSFDFDQMIALQKSLHSRYESWSGRKLKFAYFSNVEELNAFIVNKEYSIVSFYAFNEMPLELRARFIPVISKSEFALFVANPFFDEVNNNEYFNELDTKLKHMSYHTFPLRLIDMFHFQEKHRIHLFINEEGR